MFLQEEVSTRFLDSGVEQRIIIITQLMDF